MRSIDKKEKNTKDISNDINFIYIKYYKNSQISGSVIHIKASICFINIKLWGSSQTVQYDQQWSAIIKLYFPQVIS